MNAISQRDCVPGPRRHHAGPDACAGVRSRAAVRRGPRPRIRILRHRPDCGMLWAVPARSRATGWPALEQWRRT